MPALTKRVGRRIGRPRNPADKSVAKRVRALREAAGLTQAQLAGADFTKGFISLVETGRVGISLRAARVFASRLGVSVDELLHTDGSAAQDAAELALVRAEADLAAGRFDDALAGAREIDRPELRARRLRVEGRALLELDRAVEAVPLLDEAIRLFRQRGQRESIARALFDLARAYARSEAHGEAANYALQCENAILAGDVIDAQLEMRVLSFLAGVFVTLGDFQAADLRTERVRRLAEDIAEPRGAGNLYFNLAVLRQTRGDPEAALRYAMKALEAYEQLGQPAEVGSVWNTIGWIHVKRGRPAQAEQALATASALAKAAGDDRLEAYVLQTRAELALARDRADQAVELARASIDHPRASARARATSRLVLAEALARTGASIAKVDRAYAEAVKALEPFGRTHVAGAHRSHFDALMARGHEREAARVAQAAFGALRPTLS